MGILDVLRAAIPLAANARAGYLAGESQQADENRAIARQSLLDQIKQATASAQANEANARSDYWRAYADQRQNGEPVQWVIDADGNRVPLPKTLPASGATPAGPIATLKAAVAPDQSAPPDQTGQTGQAGQSADIPIGTMGFPLHVTKAPSFQVGQPSGVTAPKPKAAANTGPRTVTTDQGVMVWDARQGKYVPTGYTHTPARGTGGAGGGSGSLLDETRRQKLADALAFRAVNAVGGDPIQAMSYMERPGEIDRATQAGLKRADYYNAAAKWRGMDAKARDQHLRTIDYLSPGAGQDSLAASTAPSTSSSTAASTAITRGGSSTTGTPPKGPSGNINLGAPTATSAPTNPATSATTGSPYKLSAARAAAMQAEMDERSRHLAQILADPTVSAAFKRQARQSYDAKQRAIAEKYGATAGSGGGTP